jgi:hypothetical protein
VLGNSSSAEYSQPLVRRGLALSVSSDSVRYGSCVGQEPEQKLHEFKHEGESPHPRSQAGPFPRPKISRLSLGGLEEPEPEAWVKNPVESFNCEANE